MGQHPSHSAEFLFDCNNGDQVYRALVAGMQTLPGIEIEDSSDEQRTVSALHYTPVCQWVDAIVLRVEETTHGAKLVAMSRSTNVCPNWAPGRLMFSCLGGYPDWGKNKEHLDEIVAASNLRVNQVTPFCPTERKKNQ